MIGCWQGNSRSGRRMIEDFKYVKIFMIEKVVLEKYALEANLGCSAAQFRATG